MPLKKQFEASGLKALFIVPEAEINSDDYAGTEVVWRDLAELLGPPAKAQRCRSAA